MIEFLKILTLVKGYSKHAILNVFFNVLGMLFSAFSIILLIPIMEILFNQDGKVQKILENKLLNKSTNEWIRSMEKYKIPCGPIFNIKDAVENPQVEARNMIVKAYHKIIGDFKLAGNPIKMSAYEDPDKRGDIPDLDEHREKIIKEFVD